MKDAKTALSCVPIPDVKSFRDLEAKLAVSVMIALIVIVLDALVPLYDPEP